MFLSQWKWVTAAVMVGGLTLTGIGAGVGLFTNPATANGQSGSVAAPPMQRPVPTVLGPKAFRDGDVIEITDVRATSPKLEQGDSLTVRGRVRLASHDEARLSLYLTQTEGDGWEEIDQIQTKKVGKGLGEFELKATIKHRGVLHLSLYDKSGKPVGGVYFGTEPQMKGIADWSVDYFLPEGAKPSSGGAGDGKGK